MKKVITYCIIILMINFNSNAQSNIWNPIGVNDFNQASCSTTDRPKSDFALSPTGTQYLVFEDWANYQRLSVRRYNGTNWEYVGNPAISTGYIYHPKIAFDNSGTPHIAFIDANNSGKISVMKFNGTNWVVVGTNNFTPNNVGGCVMTIDASNNIYVGYYDLVQTKMFVQKYDGISWSIVNAGFGSAVTANPVDISIDATGKIYLLFGTNIGFYNGTVWSLLPKATNSNYITMSMDNSGQPIIAFDSTTSASSTSRVRCLQYNGSSWVGLAGGTVATKTLSSFAYHFTRVHFGKDNKTYVACGEVNGSTYVPKLYVSNGTSWTAVGTFSTYPYKTSTHYAYLGVDNTGKINYGLSQKEYNYGAVIHTYNNSTWSLLGHKDATGGQRVHSFSMDIASNGTPYIVGVSNDASSGRLAVKKYDGVKWDSVGTTYFNFSSALPNSGNAYYPKIKIGSSGTPYVSYTYGLPISANFTAIVKKFNGTTWTNLTATNTPVINNVSQRTDLETLANDTLLLLSINNTYNITVSKFNGSNWAALSGTVHPYTNVSTSYHDLAVDPQGIPYIAFVSQNAVGNNTIVGLHVKKHVNGNWQSVGSGTIASGAPSDVTLKFNSSGVPFVAFQCDNNLPGGRKANVMKYNGTNWVSVGNANFSPSTADMLKMELDNNGNPYVIFQTNTAIPNIPHADKLTSMQFNGTIWVNIAGNSHSAANVSETALVKNPFNGYITEAYMNLNSLLPAPNGAMAGLIWVKEWSATTFSVGENLLMPNKTSELSVFPNPAQDVLYLSSNLLSEKAGTATVYNLSGQALMTENISISNNVLSATSLKPGIYIVKLSNTKGESAIQKFVKQ